MARNGSGTYSLPAGNPVVTGTTISSTTHNNTLSDIATALTASLAKDGQTVPTANLPMGGFKLTGLGAATTAGDAVRYEQAALQTGEQVQLYTAFTTGGTSTAYTLTPSPAITANTTNQRFRVKFNAASGATPTLAVSGQTAKNLKYYDSTGTKQAITSTQVPINWISDVEYDGTDWVVLQPADTAHTASVQSFTKAQIGTPVALTDAATIALDLSLANNYLVQLGGNRTLGMPTSVVAGQSGSITVLQDKTGSRTLAYAWPYVWAAGTAGVLSTPGGSEDQLIYEVRAYNSATMTVTIATPGVVTMAAHGFYHGQRVQITTTGALPTGLTASTTYFVEVIDANSFYLCTTLANVAAGTRIATSGSQSGTHTLTGCTIRLALNKAYS